MQKKMIFKVLLVKESVAEFESLLNKGWRVAQVSVHPKGSLIALVFEARPAANGKAAAKR